MTDKAKETGPMDKRYIVITGSVGGFYTGQIVDGEDLKRVFVDADNVARHLELGSFREVLEGEFDVATEEVVTEPEAKPHGVNEPKGEPKAVAEPVKVIV